MKNIFNVPGLVNNDGKIQNTVVPFSDFWLATNPTEHKRMIEFEKKNNIKYE